jgi:pSer/pThr/pTyr-binding forkhead associated (FHA) protein
MRCCTFFTQKKVNRFEKSALPVKMSAHFNPCGTTQEVDWREEVSLFRAAAGSEEMFASSSWRFDKHHGLAYSKSLKLYYSCDEDLFFDLDSAIEKQPYHYDSSSRLFFPLLGEGHYPPLSRNTPPEDGRLAPKRVEADMQPASETAQKQAEDQLQRVDAFKYALQPELLRVQGGLPSLVLLEEDRAPNVWTERREDYCFRIGVPDVNADERREIEFTVGNSSLNNCCIRFEDASKFHAKIKWINVFWKNHFFLSDAGSKNGTFLNGVRLSEPRCASQPHELKEGDRIRFGGFAQFVVACPKREALAREMKSILDGELPHSEVPPTDPVELQRSAATQEIELRKLQALQQNEAIRLMKRSVNMLTEEERWRKKQFEHSAKKQKSKQKFEKSDQPNQDEAESKLELMTRSGALTEDNVGFKMLEQMGWRKGKGLGPDGKGIDRPIQVNSNAQTFGVGFNAK